MDRDQNSGPDRNTGGKQSGTEPIEKAMAKNPNPRANENVPEEAKKAPGHENSEGIGSEITDGEDA
ncbi:MAG TPA: hypothetical protein VFR58_11140 [Flavisolibacter sp.]|nr:hypothetical protein [Flavisolibacter sp.]